MRRFLATFAVMAIVAGIAPGAAVAQGPDPSGLTGLEPLSRVIEGFAAGEEAPALYLQGETDNGPTGLTQFQVIVNLGGGPTFGSRGVEMVPSGLSADGNLVSLEEQFDGTLGDTGQIPALAPFARGQAMDLAPAFEGWTAYGTGGLIEGPVEILEGVVAIAGIELAEPYDPECSERTYVGRAWVGSTVSAPDPLFTAEALTDSYGGADLSALAGEASRVIELACFPGSGPQMLSSRMKEDSGIRPFGPLDIFAFVKGSRVVLIAPIRVLDADLTQRFYASPPGGGDVVMSEVEDEPRLLVPNPYGPNDIRIELQVSEQPTDAEAAGAGANEGEPRTLLYQEGTGAFVPAQSGGGCTFLDPFFYLLLGQLRFELSIYEEFFGSDQLTEEIWAFLAFGPTSSGSGAVVTEEGKLTSTITDATGATQTVILNGDGTGEVSVTRGGGPPCVAPVSVVSTPDIFAGGDTATDDPSSGSTSDDDAATDEPAGGTSDDEDNGGAGGVPWGLIGIAMALLAAAAGTAYVRRRSGTKDCKPEEQAYAAAAAAYEKAKTVSDYYIGEFNHYNGEYNDYRNALQYRLDAPDRRRGYPEGPDGDKAYTDAKADWDAREAKARRAEDNIDGARENMEDARRSMDEAIKAQDTAAELLKQAREALRACKGSAPEMPGETETPPSAPTSPGGEAPTSPGTVTDTPDTPESECLEGTTKVKIERQKSFEILDGDVRIQLNKTKLNDAYPGGLIDPGVLKAQSDGELRDLFSQLEENVKPENMRWVISTTILTVKCIRIVICQGGKWVETDQTNRVEETAKGPSYQKAIRTQSKVLAQRLMAGAQSKITELQANEAAAAGFTCD